MADPIAQDVVNRIEQVTLIPQTNSESLQLLRYGEGQVCNGNKIQPAFYS